MPKIPKIGCLGIVLLALVMMVVGGMFLGVATPEVHLPPGDLLKAETPHKWTKTDKNWVDDRGVVDIEIKVQTEDKELVADEPLTLYAKPKNADNMPANPVYEWRFVVDEEEVYRIEEGGSTVEYTFTQKGDLAVDVLVKDADSGALVVGAAIHHGKKSAFPITNTMIASWITVIVLVTVMFFAMRKRSLVPTGLQNVIEAIVEWLLTFVENAAGRENGRRFFPIVATIFFFVITNAYLALLPIFNVIGWGHQMSYETAFFGDQSGFVVTTTILRSANTDVNLPLALAIVSFISVEFWGITAIGFRHYMGKFIKIKPVFKAIASFKPMEIVTAVIGAFVGLIELLTEFIRLLSFTFRLFGNMTAGEVLLMMMAFLMPLLAGVPFYGLELLIGFIQALVFAGLTLGFAMVAVIPHEEEEH
ncbi:MAG: F0F1 ATP synthase subunit A [Dehalococcoidia bacterium]|nr:F0F1 ATP synthase subunit A [Dehalococcoidia bacterium]